MVRIEVHSSLSADQVRDVTELIARVTEVDGLRPLSEHVWLHMRFGGDEQGLHVLAYDPTLIGYAHLDTTDLVAGPSAEIVVDPHHRRAGVGRALMTQLIDLSPDGRLRLWAHGEVTGAAELARSMGFSNSRVLWQMRRSLYAPLPKPQFPPGIDLRAFEVDHDEDAWLDLNARAFHDLPDQGRWTRQDLDRRIGEPWFSADGFLMAWDGPDLAGFHWTKVHGHHGEDSGQHHHESIGEVYVVGVDPRRSGRGLGRALTLAGLQYLRSMDLPQAMLYVDATNSPAVHLYSSLGFARWDTDVEFQREN